MRSRTAQLVEAFIGRFDEHHEFLLTKMLGRIDTLSTDIDAVQQRVDEELAPPWASPPSQPGATPGRSVPDGGTHGMTVATRRVVGDLSVRVVDTT